MPTKDRTLIPRFSPSKPNRASAPGMGTNTSPITLRGTGRPVSVPASVADKFTPLPPRAALQHGTLSPRRTEASPAPSSNKPARQGNGGNRIPGLFRGGTGSSSGVGLGLSFPAKNLSPKSVPRHVSGSRVSLIDSPTPKPLPASPNDNDTITTKSVAPPPPSEEIMGEQPPWSGLGMERTPTMQSNASSASAYTSRSMAPSSDTSTRLEISEEEGDGKKSEQSPGFGMIEALVNQERRAASPLAQVQAHSPAYSPLTSPALSPYSVTQNPRPESQLMITDMFPRVDSTPPTMTPSQRIAASSGPSPGSPTPDSGPGKNHLRAPLAVLHELEGVVGKERVERWVDVENVLDAHAPWRTRGPASPNAAVFGVPLSATTHYASCSSILGGQPHTLPLVVFAAIEELYHAGLRSPRLLRPPPHSATDTFPALIAAYNSAPTYGDDVDLASAPLDDVSALLLTYLDCLPGPVLVPFLRDAFVELAMENERGPQLRAVQLLLRLLPPPHFSLLVYLLAFFSQIPLHERWNGWSTRSVAQAFARVIIGLDGDADGDDKGKGKEPQREPTPFAEEQRPAMALEWLLTRWNELSDGLFGEEGGLVVPHERTLRRKPSRVFGGDNEKGLHFAPLAPHCSPRALLARIAELEDANAQWCRLYEQHDAELRAMFDEGERQMEEAVMEERRRWVREMQALREGCGRMGNAWEMVAGEMEDVDSIVRGIVGRCMKSGGDGRPLLRATAGIR